MLTYLKELKEFWRVLFGATLLGNIVLVLAVAAAGLVSFLSHGLVIDDFQPIYFFIGTAITVSGFTMLGGIFGKKNPSEVEKKLFGLSIVFLTSAFSFILFTGLFQILRPEVIDTWQMQVFVYSAMCIFCIGIILFVVGFCSLLLTLIDYYRKIGE